MALKEQIDNDIKAALLERHRFVVDTLRGLKAAILNEEVAQGQRDEGLEDVEVEGIIAREIKKRRESKALYEQNDRPELAKNEQDEIEILEKYLPEQLSEDDLKKIIVEIISVVGATDAKAMGQVIGAVKAKVGTSAEGATIARLVKEALV